MPPSKLEPLIDAIATALAASVKSYNIPAVCVGLGLSGGEGDEAFRSKAVYVRKRLSGHTQAQLLDIAEKVLTDYDAPALTDLFSEMTAHSRHRVSELTRRKVLKLLDPLRSLFGEADFYQSISVLNPPMDRVWGDILKFKSLRDAIEQHWVRNDDWDNSDLLQECGVLSCAQHRFFSLIEKVLDPVARQGEEQSQLAAQISAVLAPDGFEIHVGRYISGVPAYVVRPRGIRPHGTVKNIIFASIGEKPEIVLRDAINNDIEITKNADLCLTYDRPLSSSGLLWSTMAEWWKDTKGLSDSETARKSLGTRLMESVKQTTSPGEYAVFRTYYKATARKYGKALPALIPQIYLHFDPNNRSLRGSATALVRQRMDFLLLLRDGARVVIEIDGKRHYAEGDIASPRLYAEMMAEDRRLRLAGYELYRFGAAEFPDTRLENGRYSVGPISEHHVVDFFDRLFEVHSVAQSL
jgi:hypothetical protein